MSFYFRFKINTSITIYNAHNYYSACIYDTNGILRQKCQLLSPGSMNSFSLLGSAIGDDFFVVSENNSFDPNKLKIPFNNISKIIIISEPLI